MSTKAIMEALARWEAIHGPEAPEFVERALAEVEAIKRAARYAAHSKIPGNPDDAKHFMDTMLAIADQETT